MSRQKAHPCYKPKTNSIEMFGKTAPENGKIHEQAQFCAAEWSPACEGWKENRACCRQSPHYLDNTGRELSSHSFQWRDYFQSWAKPFKLWKCHKSISVQGCPILEQISPHLCLGLVRLSPWWEGSSFSLSGIVPGYPWLVHDCLCAS